MTGGGPGAPRGPDQCPFAQKSEYVPFPEKCKWHYTMPLSTLRSVVVDKVKGDNYVSESKLASKGKFLPCSIYFVSTSEEFNSATATGSTYTLL